MSNQVIQIPHKILRSFIQQHPEWNFVFGWDRIKRGCLGQCWQTVGEPNCFPIFTCHKLCPSGSVYFMDTWDSQKIVLECISLIPQDKPIIVFRKIGEGCSRMKEFAPKLHANMHKTLDEMAYKPIEITNTYL